MNTQYYEINFNELPKTSEQLLTIILKWFIDIFKKYDVNNLEKTLKFMDQYIDNNSYYRELALSYAKKTKIQNIIFIYDIEINKQIKYIKLFYSENYNFINYVQKFNPSNPINNNFCKYYIYEKSMINNKNIVALSVSLFEKIIYNFNNLI